MICIWCKSISWLVCFFVGFFFLGGGGVANVVNAAALPVEIVKELV